MDVDRLKVLRSAAFLEQWTPGVSKGDVEKTRSIIERGIDEIVGLGPEASESACVEVLRAIVRALNEADDGFICTLEREDLCDFLFAIGGRAGVRESAVQEVLEERDW